MFSFWLGFGAILIVSELILPGLVSVFVGLGALTVAGLIHYGWATDITSQLLHWFGSSTFYIFSLRLLVMKYYPSDREKQNIDEDQLMIGQVVEVVQPISHDESGRFVFGESSWVALSTDGEPIAKGEQVEIVGRDNITWLVKRALKEEN